MKAPARLVSSLGLAALCALVAGCQSPRHERTNDREGPALHRVALRGDSAYFDGTLRAEATISRGRPVPFSEREGGGGEGGQRRVGGLGGRRHGGGGMGGGGYHGGDDNGDGSPALHMSASRLPPVTLRLRLENTSKAPIDVEIEDVKSDLGDFAVRPDRLTLAPDQATEVDPMVSELGVTSDEIPVTVVLRAGGKTESHDLQLKTVPPPTEPK